MVNRRSSITEQSAILLASETLDYGNSIMVDASIKPPSSSVYVSPKRGEKMELQAFADPLAKVQSLRFFNIKPGRKF